MSSYYQEVSGTWYTTIEACIFMEDLVRKVNYYIINSVKALKQATKYITFAIQRSQPASTVFFFRYEQVAAVVLLIEEDGTI